MRKRYLPKSLRAYIINTIIFMGFLLFMVYNAFEEGSLELIVSSILGTLFMCIIFYHIGWRFIKVEDDYVLLVNGLRRKNIAISKLQYLNMGYHRFKFSSNKVPAVLVYYKNMKEPFPIYHMHYNNNDFVDFLEYIRIKNHKIDFCKSLNSMIKGTEYDLKKQYKKDEKQLFIIMLIAFVITFFIAILK